MRTSGESIENLECGNAWDDLFDPISNPKSNWIVGSGGSIPAESLRFVQRDDPDSSIEGALSKHVSVKWFVHEPAHPAEWGTVKEESTGRTLSILAGEGKFKLKFWKKEVPNRTFDVILDQPGDFVIWGAGLMHSWRPIERSTILTVRWEPVSKSAGPSRRTKKT